MEEQENSTIPTAQQNILVLPAWPVESFDKPIRNMQTPQEIFPRSADSKSPSGKVKPRIHPDHWLKGFAFFCREVALQREF